jgi:predicted dinucleotide-binding enzyme
MTEVVVVIGPGQIGQAIARRVGFGKHVLLADKRQENADAAAEEKNRQTYHNKKNAMMIPPNLLSELLARLRSLVKRGGQKLQ